MNVSIIGGGIAGLSTAISLKQLDPAISITIYEKHKKIAFNHNARCCGEAFFSEKDNKWIPKETSYFNKILETDVIIGNKTYTERFPIEHCPTFMLNKPMFINQLAEKAKECNVEFIMGKMIKRPKDIDADVIVDASGCPSCIRKSLGINHGMKGLTYQETLADCNCFQRNKILIYYFGNVGYYWVFPRDPNKKEVNVGVGILDTKKVSLPYLLAQFRKKMNIIGEPVYYAGGQIPLGLQRPLKKGNILFVGDAGVGTFPYLGEGIRRSLINGEIASFCISKKRLNDYPTMMLKRFYLWDFIGKMGLRVSKTASKISENALFYILQKYFDFVYSQYDLKY